MEVLLEITLEVVFSGFDHRGKKQTGYVSISKGEREIIALVVIIAGMHYCDDQIITKRERAFVKEFLKQTELKLSHKTNRKIRKLKRKKMNYVQVKVELNRLKFNVSEQMTLINRLTAPVSLLGINAYKDYLVGLKNSIDQHQNY